MLENIFKMNCHVLAHADLKGSIMTLPQQHSSRIHTILQQDVIFFFITFPSQVTSSVLKTPRISWQERICAVQPPQQY